MATPTTNPAAEAEAFHTATADVIAILGVLLERGGWTSPGQLGLTVHRDTARRILRELARASWAEMRELEGETRFRIGPELPRIGLAYLSLLQAEQEQIASRYQAATVPHAWTHGAHGLSWKPAPNATPTRKEPTP